MKVIKLPAHDATWEEAPTAQVEATRHCTKCKRMKPVSEFHKHPHNPYGVQVCCKVCRKRLYDASRKEANEINRRLTEENIQLRSRIRALLRGAV